MEEIVKNGLQALLKSMLSCGPTYCFLLFAIPTFVANRLERFQRNFFVGWFEWWIQIPFCRMKYECSPKNGGFESAQTGCFQSIFVVLGKKQIIYGDEWLIWKIGKFGSMDIKGDHKYAWCSFYTHIRAGWDSFESYVQFEIRDGLRLWHNLWCWNQSLKELYMKLYVGEEVNHLWRWVVDLKDRKIQVNGYQGWSQVRMM